MEAWRCVRRGYGRCVVGRGRSVRLGGWREEEGAGGPGEPGGGRTGGGRRRKRVWAVARPGRAPGVPEGEVTRTRGRRDGRLRGPGARGRRGLEATGFCCPLPRRPQASRAAGPDPEGGARLVHPPGGRLLVCLVSLQLLVT
jgi:hypothetical protein